MAFQLKPSLSSSGRSQGQIAAVLVESQKLYYVYRKTERRAASGLQDVVDMCLAPGETVLGARLVETAGGGDSGGCSAVALLILTQRRLLVHVLHIGDGQVVGGEVHELSVTEVHSGVTSV